MQVQTHLLLNAYLNGAFLLSTSIDYGTLFVIASETPVSIYLVTDR